jgi:hypothetical protein
METNSYLNIYIYNWALKLVIIQPGWFWCPRGRETGGDPAKVNLFDTLLHRCTGRTEPCPVLPLFFLNGLAFSGFRTILELSGLSFHWFFQFRFSRSVFLFFPDFIIIFISRFFIFIFVIFIFSQNLNILKFEKY